MRQTPRFVPDGGKELEEKVWTSRGLAPPPLRHWGVDAVAISAGLCCALALFGLWRGQGLRTMGWVYAPYAAVCVLGNGAAAVGLWKRRIWGLWALTAVQVLDLLFVHWTGDSKWGSTLASVVFVGVAWMQEQWLRGAKRLVDLAGP